MLYLPQKKKKIRRRRKRKKDHTQIFLNKSHRACKFVSSLLLHRRHNGLERIFRFTRLRDFSFDLESYHFKHQTKSYSKIDLLCYCHDRNHIDHYITKQNHSSKIDLLCYCWDRNHIHRYINL